MSSRTVVDPSREVPVAGECDVVVCGGGPAGVAAAVASARAGASTVLIEAQSCLGGIWTSGMLPWVIDRDNKGGLMLEMDALLRRKELPLGVDPSKSAYDVEGAKCRLEQFCLDAGVRLRLHTRVCGAICGNRRISAVLTESKSGREAWCGVTYVDATGDGDLAAQCGCGFDYGRPDVPGEAQPMSMICMISGVSLDGIREFVNGAGSSGDWGAPKQALRKLMEEGGAPPSYAMPTIFHVYDDLFLMMANHQYGVSGMDADDLTRATVEGRAEAGRIVSALRSRGGPWSNIVLVGTSSHIGVREGRRVHGVYTLTREDLERGAEFPDAVCRATFCVDIHSTRPSEGKGLGNGGVKAKPYDIPMRSLIARDVSNLMLAGRCISGDFFAHASYRVTGNAVPTGEAAGMAAAAAAKSTSQAS